MLSGARHSYYKIVRDFDLDEYNEIEEIVEVTSKKTENVDDFVQNIELNLLEKIRKLPKGKVSVQGIAEFTLKLIVFLQFLLICVQFKRDQLTSSEITEIKEEQIETNEHLLKLNELGERLVPHLEQLAKRTDNESLVIVTKNSPLRKNPSPKADSLGRLYPNQLLETIGEEKRWLKVKYFDHRDSLQKVGWVYKGNISTFN